MRSGVVPADKISYPPAWGAMKDPQAERFPTYAPEKIQHPGISRHKLIIQGELIMKFGFIAHPNDQKEKNMLKIMKQMNALNLFDSAEEDEFTSGIDFIDFTLISKTGARAEGRFLYIPWFPQDILEQSEEALPVIVSAAKELEAWGADIIGLGGYTACIGRRGMDVQEQLTRARVTTGNSFTAVNSVDTLHYILEKADLPLQEMNITIVGFPGSIALLMAKMLLLEGATLTVVGRRQNLAARKYFSDMEDEYSRVHFTTDLKEALAASDVVFTATTTGGFIPQEDFPPGCIIIDVGEPKDVRGEMTERSDLLIVDGGRFSFDEDVEIEGMPFGQMIRSGFFGCVGETALIALAEDFGFCSTGRVLDLAKAGQLRETARAHGFVVNGISEWKKNVGDGDIHRIGGIIKKRKSLHEEKDIFEALKTAEKEEILDIYSSYINSVLVAVNRSGNYDRLYVRAEGVKLWDNEENEYLDFVGGYGSVNLGHNHPAVTECVRRFLESGLPSLLQVAPGYCAAMLAQKLVSLMPGDLSKVFFCNSGTEAVEGALKIARIHTGRSKYLSAKNSFHGKSFGSLSVTGREKYQEHFRPLLNSVDFVEYNALEGVEELLETQEYAAVIIEPVQGEGGINVADPQYLRELLSLCHKYGTLLIADEVQTGFGRTGTMFAVESAGIVPDILTCAKSLGGGLVPIGAYVTTKEIWDGAYGSQSKYLLHTSTFGGNAFCASVAVAALDAIQQEQLPQNADKIGKYLLENLRKIAADYRFIKEVRGKGLLIGIEFQYSVNEGLTAILDLIRSMVPADVMQMTEALSSSIVDSFRAFLDENVENIEQYLNDNFASQFSAALLNEENILTIVTLNNPNVIRIEPPLIITMKEADRFLEAFRRICEKNRQFDLLTEPEEDIRDEA